MSRTTLVGVWIACWVWAGCGVTVPEGRYRCDPANPECPSGWFCHASDQRCYSYPEDAADVPDVPDDVEVSGDEGGDLPEGGDDGDADDGDGGCDPASCSDRNDCNGTEVCTVDGACVPTRPLADGTACSIRDADGEVIGAGFCAAERCRPETCGDGTRQFPEECDDGNLVDGDGCEADCTWSCERDEDCDDGGICNGEESCLDYACVPGTPAPVGTACGTGLVCDDGACIPGGCGDGVLGDLEQCDDGNDLPGDGCEPDCTWSCEADLDCDDARFCNGAERCDPAAHRCLPGSQAADGTPCRLAGGEDGLCRGGACASADCGNGTLDPGEQCDDGDLTERNGCDNDCTWSCETDVVCLDGLTCNGVERCNLDTHTCAPGTAPADGSACDRDGNPETREICLAGACRASACGDGFLDPGLDEQCDDGNPVEGDGCEPATCTFSCTVAADCDDGDLCDGSERCDDATHRCLPGTAQADGTSCSLPGGNAGECRLGVCTRLACGNGTLDAGEECDDGNAAAGDGCEANCRFSCGADRDCRESPDDVCTTDTCVAGGTGQICRRAPSLLPCDDRDPCTSGDRCNASSLCRGTLVDADGDTYGPGAGCGGDCDDGAAAVNPAEVELCNGRDDDCSGTADDGAGMTCAAGATRSCLATGGGGVTCAGSETCTAVCAWAGSCAITATEVCNGADDDCDGTVDEGFECVAGASMSCTSPCGGAGSRTCGAACAWSPCAAVETCNGCDDDADGLIDDGLWCTVTVPGVTGDLLAVRGSSLTDVWIVGAAGRALHWDGTAWSTTTTGTTRHLRGVWVDATGDAWAVGDNGTVIRWNGTVWATETSGTSADLYAVWGPSATDLWAVGEGGAATHRTAAGWAAVDIGTSRHLRDVRGAGTEVYAVGERGTVRRLSGGTWGNVATGNNSFWYAVSATTAGNVWVAGEGGNARLWDGLRWIGTPTGAAGILHDVRVLSASSAWLVGEGGVILRWDGTAWGAGGSPVTSDLYALWGASAADLWAVGASGRILRRVQ